MNILRERFHFHHRQQRIHETIEDFALELRRLASSCQFNDLEASLVRDHLLFGLRNQNLTVQIIESGGDPDLTDVLQICMLLENNEFKLESNNVGKPTADGAFCEEAQEIPIDVYPDVFKDEPTNSDSENDGRFASDAFPYDWPDNPFVDSEPHTWEEEGSVNGNYSHIKQQMPNANSSAECGTSTASHAQGDRILNSSSEKRTHANKPNTNIYRRRRTIKKPLQQVEGAEARRYECFICHSDHHTSLAVLRQHLYWHSREKKFRCNQCGLLVMTKYNLNAHMMRKDHQIGYVEKPQDMPSVACPYCPNNYTKLGSFLYHMKKIHRDQSNTDAYQEHLDRAIQNARVSCNICAKPCRDRYTMKQHIEAQHPEALGNDDPRNHECFECHKVFKSLPLLKQHIRTHADRKRNKRNIDMKRFVCSVCQKSFATERKRELHLVAKHKETSDGTKLRQFECYRCHKKVKSLWVLHTHIREHFDLKKHLCSQCGHLAPSRTALKLHITRVGHEGTVNAHHCHVCGKAFRTKFKLDRHAIRHSEVKAHSCNICGKMFQTKNDLGKHMDLHGEKKHHCHLCPYKSYRKSNVKLHMKVHMKDNQLGHSNV